LAKAPVVAIASSTKLMVIFLANIARPPLGELYTHAIERSLSYAEGCDGHH
jgi:hypothetical protein